MSERYSGQQNQNHQNQNAGFVDLGDYFTTRIIDSLELSSEIGSGCAGFGVDQVSGSDCANEIAGLGEVLTLVFACEESGVSAGRRSAPCDVLTGLCVNLESPAGIYPLDSSVGDFNNFENIFKSNQFCFEFDPWPKENQPAAKAKQQGYWQRPTRSPESDLDYRLNECQGQHYPNQDGYELAESRVKNLHSTNDSPMAGVFA
jgi:hypothetical protein